jgi:hypothetical protein
MSLGIRDLDPKAGLRAAVKAAYDVGIPSKFPSTFSPLLPRPLLFEKLLPAWCLDYDLKYCN